MTDSQDGRKYWNKLKQRLKAEGSELVTKCHQLKMKSTKDGKMYKTDCANTEELLRIIQSIPSKKAEPFKQCMTNTELVLNQLAEISTTELSRNINPKGYGEAEDVTVSGGQIAANARKDLENRLGRSIISSLNATMPVQLDDSRSVK